MRLHPESTVGRRYSQITLRWEREIADDDAHLTIRMGDTPDRYKLHGHLYIQEGECEVQKRGMAMNANGPKRLMTEEERKYIDG